MRNLGLILAALLLLAAPASAAFKTTVTKTDAFKSANVKKVVFVTLECDDTIDCYAIQRKAASEARKMKTGFVIADEGKVREMLLSKGHTAYTTELREWLATELGVDALFEINVPFGTKGDGWFGQRGSRAKVEMNLVQPDGAILIHAVGTGRPLNVVTGPERVAGNIIEKILKKAFK